MGTRKRFPNLINSVFHLDTWLPLSST